MPQIYVTCPHCKRQNDLIDLPRPGSSVVCVRCGHSFTFLGLSRSPTGADDSETPEPIPQKRKPARSLAEREGRDSRKNRNEIEVAAKASSVADRPVVDGKFLLIALSGIGSLLTFTMVAVFLIIQSNFRQAYETANRDRNIAPAPVIVPQHSDEREQHTQLSKQPEKVETPTKPVEEPKAVKDQASELLKSVALVGAIADQNGKQVLLPIATAWAIQPKLLVTRAADFRALFLGKDAETLVLVARTGEKDHSVRKVHFHPSFPQKTLDADALPEQFLNYLATDLAVIELEGDGLPVVLLRAQDFDFSRMANSNSTITVLSFLPMAPILSSGPFISAHFYEGKMGPYAKAINHKSVAMFDGYLSWHMGGSPVLNASNQVIGVLLVMFKDQGHHEPAGGFIVSINQVDAILDALKKQ